MPAANPADRSIAGRIAAHSRWAKDDPVAGTASARQAFLAKFERDVDPDGALEPAERRRRAEHARQAHMARLALASAKARRARSAAGDAA